MNTERLSSVAVVELPERIEIPAEYPFPYTPESFTEEEKEVLLRFFTNVDRPVFAIYNLPQEVVGALFSRYSRTEGGARRVFLDEFWKAPELGIQNIAEHLFGQGEESLKKTREQARRFYRRVFAEYGDDSVIQMGSVHVAFEYGSQIAAKAIEDQRIAAAYIEKSTRYVDFGTLENGHFLFMEVPEIMNSEFGQEYLAWNNSLFKAYLAHLPTAVEYCKRKYPIEEQIFDVKQGDNIGTFKFLEVTDEKVRGVLQKAYARALKAKAFDTIRVFLPTTTVTNLGAHFSGQTAENALNKMLASPYSEVRLLGAMAYAELLKVAPSFLQNVSNNYGAAMRVYLQEVRRLHQEAANEFWPNIIPENSQDVLLVDYDRDADVKIAAQIIYDGDTGTHHSKHEILQNMRAIKYRELQENPGRVWSEELARMIITSVPDRSMPGLNRRHKLPRAFEHAFAEVEFNIDFGVFRDLQRNRMSSTGRQWLSAEELFVPKEFKDVGMEEVLRDYLRYGEWTRQLHNNIAESPVGAQASEYVTMLGNKLRFNIRANIRQWCFFAELRTIPGGHPTYRNAMQEAARQILEAMPFLRPLFSHVDWTPNYGLGRLKAELRTQERLERI